ncbi:MAG: hypothetical protein ACRBFS_14090 [Aureispira sp.]
MNPIDDCGPFKAMEYEYVMRRIYNCGRNYRKGADADIFRRFMRNASTYRDKVDGKFVNNTRTKEKLETIHESSMTDVVSHLRNGLRFTLSSHKDRFSSEQITKLEKCSQLLVQPSIEDVLDVVDYAQNVLVEAGINMG